MYFIFHLINILELTMLTIFLFFVFNKKKKTSQRTTKNLNYKTLNRLEKFYNNYLQWCYWYTFYNRRRHTIIYSLHNFSNMENNVHFELLKYGLLQLMNFLLYSHYDFSFKRKNFIKDIIR